MAANGKQIQLDGNLFHTLTLGNATSSQLVYMTNHATCLFLSQKVPNELRRAIGLPGPSGRDRPNNSVHRHGH